MGINLDYWSYQYQPVKPVRFGYYGGLGSAVNHHQALFTIQKIMPIIWSKIPSAEIWLIGSNPRKELLSIASSDSRIYVTGYLQDPRQTLSEITAFCPWKGIFGFRSRIVELMALGIPVIASPDAVAGMGLEAGNGLFLAENEEGFAEFGCRLGLDPTEAAETSKIARKEAERLFSTKATYGNLFTEIQTWAELFKKNS